VYVPAVNVALGLACVLLVIAFRSSDRLAAAYGLAVSATMLATSIVWYDVITKRLQWKKIVAIPLLVAFVAIDGTFVGASLPKFLDGAWVPLLLSAVLVTSAMTWLSGRRCVGVSLSQQALPLDDYLRDAAAAGTAERAGRMVFLTGDPDRVPFIHRHRWLRTRADEERIVLLTLERSLRPYVPDDSRVSLRDVDSRLCVVRAAFGFMERPKITPVLEGCATRGLHLDSDDTSFFYAEPKFIKARTQALPAWQRGYFAFLFRNARTLTDDLEIRADRRVEIGVEVEL
jgi:KUP system potassium uptake protein